MSVVGGVPGRVLKDRREVSAAREATRVALADITRKTAEAARHAATNRDDSISGVSSPTPR